MTSAPPLRPAVACATAGILLVLAANTIGAGPPADGLSETPQAAAPGIPEAEPHVIPSAPRSEEARAIGKGYGKSR